MKLNKNIAALRKKKGLTQEELAQVFGVTNQAVSKWESSQSCPDVALLPKIAGYFGVSVDALMGVEPSLTRIVSAVESIFSSVSNRGPYTCQVRGSCC